MKVKVFLLALNLIFVGSCLSQYTIEWTGAKDNLWSEPDNWNEERIPTSDDYVRIDNGDTVQVKSIVPTINQLHLVQSGLVISESAELTIQESAMIALKITSGYFENIGLLQIIGIQDNAIENRNNSVIINRGEVTILDVIGSAIQNQGVITNEGGQITIEEVKTQGISNFDTIINNGDLIIRDFDANPDPNVFGEAAIINNLNSYFENNGNIEIRDGENSIPAFDNRSYLYNSNSITINSVANNLFNRDSIDNIGNITLIKVSLVNDRGSFLNDSTATLRIHTSSGITNTGTFSNKALITIDSSAGNGINISDGQFHNYDSIHIQHIAISGIFSQSLFKNHIEGKVIVSHSNVSGINISPEGTYENRGSTELKNINQRGINNNGLFDQRGDLFLSFAGNTGIINRANFGTQALTTISICDSDRGIINEGGFTHGGIMNISNFSKGGLINDGTFVVLGPSLHSGISEAFVTLTNSLGATPLENQPDSVLEVWGNLSIE